MLDKKEYDFWNEYEQKSSFTARVKTLWRNRKNGDSIDEFLGLYISFIMISFIFGIGFITSIFIPSSIVWATTFVLGVFYLAYIMLNIKLRTSIKLDMIRYEQANGGT